MIIDFNNKQFSNIQSIISLRLRISFALVTIMLVAASCGQGSQKKEEQEKQIVTVSILPLQTFVEKIAGDDFTIQVLVPQGASPETYSLLPSQLKQLSHSRAWFNVGFLEFELSLQHKIQQINPNMKIADLSEGLDLIVGKEIQHGDHVHLEGVDPHTWLSPKQVKVMAGHIVQTLSELNKDKQDIYRKNYNKFLIEIDSLDTQISEALKDYQGRSFVIFHPSLSYFARDYGLIQHPLEQDGKEPTTQNMIKMVDLARKEHIKAIYIQNEFDNDHAKVFAEEINGKIIEISPLDPDWQENLLLITQKFIENF